jgi:hypothetical protein
LVELPDEFFERGIGLALEGEPELPVALEGRDDWRDEVWGQGEEFGFGPVAHRESRGDVGLAGSAATIGFAAFAAQTDQGAAEHRQVGAGIGGGCIL